MSDDAELFEVLADLEAEAGTLHHLERVAEVADRSRAEYRAVLLEARLMASVGSPVVLRVAGVGHLSGVLDRVGDQWCHVVGPGARWVVALPAVTTASGVSGRALPRVGWSRLDVVGIGQPLRSLAEAGSWCTVHLLDGGVVEGRVLRVGGDFLELAGASGRPVTEHVLVHLAALGAVRTIGD